MQFELSEICADLPDFNPHLDSVKAALCHVELLWTISASCYCPREMPTKFGAFIADIVLNN